MTEKERLFRRYSFGGLYLRSLTMGAQERPGFWQLHTAIFMGLLLCMHRITLKQRIVFVAFVWYITIEGNI